MDREARERAQSAILALEAVLQKGPRVPHREVAEAIGYLILMRNRLIDSARAGKAPRTWLDQANSLVSLSYGAENPLIGFHMHRLEQTRDGLKALLSSASTRPG